MTRISVPWQWGAGEQNALNAKCGYMAEEEKGKEELGESSFVGLDQFTIITRRS